MADAPWVHAVRGSSLVAGAVKPVAEAVSQLAAAVNTILGHSG